MLDFLKPRNSVSAVKSIHPREASALIGQKDVMLIDVREPAEFADAHIAQAKLMPLGGVLNHATELAKHGQVIVVCRSGNRSRSACQALRARGVQQVINLEGGMIAWQMAGLPIRRS